MPSLWTLHRISTCILLTIAFAFYGCSSSGDGNGENGDGPRGGAWTVFVYMAADNNLGSDALRDMNEMEEIGSTELVDVIVQVDLLAGCRRYRIESDSNPLVVTSPVLKDLGEQDMTDPDTLEKFLRWGKTNYPADRYLVVLWGHGDAWQDERMQVMAIFDDDNPDRDKLTPNYRVRRAMERAGMRADILAFDACDMSILEAAYEFRGRADFMVASQELVWQDGYPYDDILAALVSDPVISPEELASTLVLLYGSYYTSVYPNTRLEQCLSALDLSQTASVANAVDRLAEDLLEDIEDVDFHDTLQIVREESETFTLLASRYVDLLDLAAGLESEPELGLNTDPLESAISSMVVENFHRGGHPGASGLSIYFPRVEYYYYDDPSYDNFAPGSGTGSPSAFMNFSWDEFLKDYFANMP